MKTPKAFQTNRIPIPPRQPQKQAPTIKHAFRQKVDSSDPTAICTTTSGRVGRRTLRELLDDVNGSYAVPIFQRRYCWTAAQWDTLWNDALQRMSLRHSLGRLTCTNAAVDGRTDSSNTQRRHSTIMRDRSIIIDGQQRFTTITLVLAAIRDALIAGGAEREDPRIRSIHRMLFVDSNAMAEWVNASNDVALQEGMALDFCRLIPTYCDRSAYLASVLPPWAFPVSNFRDHSYNPRWHRPLLAKDHFSEAIRPLLAASPESSGRVLERLERSLLDGIDMLYFPVDLAMPGGIEDDAQVVYERLAVRDATFCRPKRPSEYHAMDGSDMIRNLLLGSLGSTAQRTDFYRRYWLPLERMHQGTSPTDEARTDEDGEEEEEGVREVLRAFCAHETAKLAAGQRAQLSRMIRGSASGAIGGRIYKEFETWMAYDYHRLWKEQASSASTSAEAHTRDVGRRLLEFAEARTKLEDPKRVAALSRIK